MQELSSGGYGAADLISEPHAHSRIIDRANTEGDKARFGILYRSHGAVLPGDTPVALR
jgi:hypothetical protein